MQSEMGIIKVEISVPEAIRALEEFKNNRLRAFEALTMEVRGAVAEFLLAHLSLLFVPVGVGVMTHLGLLSQYGLRLGVVIVLSTWVGLGVTALVLRALMRRDGVDTAHPADKGAA